MYRESKPVYSNHQGGSSIEVHSFDFFTFIFELSGWALVAPSCIEDYKALLSNYLQPLISTLSTITTWLPTGLLGCATKFENIGRNVVVASERGSVETGPTVLVATALHPEYCWEGTDPVYSHYSQHFCTSEFLLI